MRFTEFLIELDEKGIEISFKDGKIKYSGPEENVTPELIDNLRKNKGRLIRHFWPKELKWLMPISPDGNKTPLFIVHGDNLNYIISEYLGRDQPIYGFFHPGSEGDGFYYKSVEEIAALYLDMLRRVSPEGPYYFIGYSFGGIIAYEMAVQLQEAGEHVPFLAIVDSVNPRAQEPKKRYENIFMAFRMSVLRPVRRTTKRKINTLICNIYLLFRKPIPAERRGYYLWDKYITLTKKYHPSRFDGDILLFRATDQPSTYKYLGWENFVNKIKLVEIEGKHLDLFTGEERIRVFQKEIEDYLFKIRSYENHKSVTL